MNGDVRNALLRILLHLLAYYRLPDGRLGNGPANLGPVDQDRIKVIALECHTEPCTS